MKKFILIALITSSLFSCQRNIDDEKEYSEGDVEFALLADNSDNTTKSTIAAVGDFKVELINSKNVIFKRWEKFEEISGQKVPMNVGEYRIRAVYGDTTAVGFDVVNYKGEKTFMIKGQSTTEVSLVCKRASVKVGVEYGEDLKADYVSYRSEVWNMAYNDRRLQFAQDETRQGFLPAGKIVYRLYVINDEGKELSYTTEPVAYSAADFIHYNINTVKAPTGDVNITITIDTSTEDKDVTIDIPAIMLPKPAPTFSYDGFDLESGRVSMIEGLAPTAANLNINSKAGIKSCVMSVTSPALIERGWPASIDFFNLSAEVTTILENDGLLWVKDMTDLQIANIDFSGLAKILQYTEDSKYNSSFSVVVTDIYNQESTISCGIDVAKAELILSPIESYNMWGTKAILAASTTGNPELVSLEYSLNGTYWQALSYTTNISDKNISFNLTNLTPATNYKFRIKYNSNSSEVKEARTEDAANVGNAGFEEWTKGQVVSYSVFGNKYQETYFPWSGSNKWWDSNNKETTKKSTTPSNLTFKCFPTTSYIAGRNGGNAAQIMAIAVNTGNTSGTSLSDAKPGYVFIGTMNDDFSKSEGHSFSSRPSSMSFYYKYKPADTDEFSAYVRLMNGSTLIGEGEFKKTASSDISQWTEAVANINYSVTNIDRKSVV